MKVWKTSAFKAHHDCLAKCRRPILRFVWNIQCMIPEDASPRVNALNVPYKPNDCIFLSCFYGTLHFLATATCSSQ